MYKFEIMEGIFLKEKIKDLGCVSITLNDVINKRKKILKTACDGLSSMKNIKSIIRKNN